MNNENALEENIERYLNGGMTGEERSTFEQAQKDDRALADKVTAQRTFFAVLKQYRERVELEGRLNAIHNEMDVHTMVGEMTAHPSQIVQLWRNHHSKISVAASIAIFAVMAAMFFTGYFSNKPGYEQLSSKIDNAIKKTDRLDQKTNTLIKQIGAHPHFTSPGNYRGSGFALSADGYIVTNYHVVSGKFDSLYVQDAAGGSYRAKLVYTEPQYDLAVLKIEDDSFERLPALPYNFRKGKSDMAEDVFSIGYSEGDSPVMDKGYISSVNGYQSDTVKYRISIPVNPGDSGGPLLNSSGSVIGIISGRQAQTEGASYAVKAGYLFKAIKNIPLDSLSDKLTLNNHNALAGLKPVQLSKKLQNYVFMVKVY